MSEAISRRIIRHAMEQKPQQPGLEALGSNTGHPLPDPPLELGSLDSPRDHVSKFLAQRRARARARESVVAALVMDAP